MDKAANKIKFITRKFLFQWPSWEKLHCNATRNAGGT